MHSTLRQTLHSLYSWQSFEAVWGIFLWQIMGVYQIFHKITQIITTTIARKAVLLHRFLEWLALQYDKPLTDTATQ